MKRIVVMLLVILAAVLLCACGAKETMDPDDFAEKYLSDPVPEETAPPEADGDPSLLRVAAEDQYDPGKGSDGEDALIGRTVFVYDGAGNPIRSIRRNADGVCAVSEMEYDSRGQVVHQTDFRHIDGDEWAVTDILMEYDEAGRMTRKTVYDGSTALSFADGEYRPEASVEFAFDSDTLYEYDEAGQPVRETRLTQQGDVKDSYEVSPQADPEECEYDGAGRVIRRTVYNSHGDINFVETFVYDEYGNLIRKDTYDQDGDHENYFVYTYAPFDELTSVEAAETAADKSTVPPGVPSGDLAPSPEESLPTEAPVPEEVPQEGDSEMFMGVLPAAHVGQIQALGYYVSGMIEFPNFEIWHCYANPDELMGSYMLMAVWQQEKEKKSSGTSSVGAGEVEQRIFEIFGKEIYFGDMTDGPVGGMDIPVSYQQGDFVFDLSADYGIPCILSYVEDIGGGAYFCELDVSMEGRLVPQYQMTIVPARNSYGYIVTSMMTVN